MSEDNNGIVHVIDRTIRPWKYKDRAAFRPFEKEAEK